MGTPERDRTAEQLLTSWEPLVDAAVGRLAAGPRASGAGGDLARRRQEIGEHIDALAAALRGLGPEQFGEYCALRAVFSAGLGAPPEALGAALDALGEGLGALLDPASAQIALEALGAGRRRVGAVPLVTPAALMELPVGASPPGGAASAAEALARAAPRIARMTVALSYMRRPADALAHGRRRARCLEDAERHLTQLVAAVDLGEPALFGEYSDWAQTLLTKLGLDPAELVNHLGALRDVLAIALPPDLAEAPRRCVTAALDRLTSTECPSFLDPGAPLAALARAYFDAVRAGDRARALSLVLASIDAGTAVHHIYTHVIQPCQYEVGRLYHLKQLTVAEEHYFTAVTQMVLSQLYPLIVNPARVDRRVVATAVEGNLHEIGARFVADFFEMAGWDTFYLGASTPTEHVLLEVARRKADVLAVSAMLSDHLPGVRALIHAVRDDDAFRDVIVLVGGQPFRIIDDLWRRLGADGSAPSAEGAVDLAERLLAARAA
ncbi:cobalamin B12-binding domain-containing protein [Sorangium sp. So ce131]|uniref:cobalamin B12-binding domain-containing protein n=1 Tax=Sorangium sp. So ce131 TaxID=3133282 RepID=UPI003F614FEF